MNIYFNGEVFRRFPLSFIGWTKKTSHTLIWWWCSAPARLCECLWSGSLRRGMKQWSRPWTPASQSEWTSRDPRGQSQTCSWCWTSCPWWHGSDPQWSSPGGGVESRGRGVGVTFIHLQLAQAHFYFLFIICVYLFMSTTRSHSK